MALPMTCPDPAQLQDLLDGRLPSEDEADLVEHLNSCELCPTRLEAMAADGSLVESVKHANRELPPVNSAYWPAVKALSRDAGRTSDSAETTPDDGLRLDFLSPPEQPGNLGRLGHYEVVRVLGRGAMGIVLKGF